MAFFLFGYFATWLWLPSFPCISYCLWRCICAAYFPLCLSSLLTFSLFSLVNLLLSPLDSVIVILKQPLSSPTLSACLSQFPLQLISTLQRCFHLLFSLVFLPLLLLPSFSLSHSVFFLHDAWEDLSMFFSIMQLKAPSIHEFNEVGETGALIYPSQHPHLRQEDGWRMS